MDPACAGRGVGEGEEASEGGERAAPGGGPVSASPSGGRGRGVRLDALGVAGVDAVPGLDMLIGMRSVTTAIRSGPRRGADWNAAIEECMKRLCRNCTNYGLPDNDGYHLEVRRIGGVASTGRKLKCHARRLLGLVRP